MDTATRCPLCRKILWFTISLLTATGYAAAQHHTRLVVTCGNSHTFPFDPLTNRYASGSLLAATTFVEQWREELGTGQVCWVDIPLRKLPLGEAVYHHLGDSTLRQRVMQHGGCLTGPSGDSLLTRFGIRQAALDSLDDTEWLVVDRYEVDGRTATQAKRYDNRNARPSHEVENQWRSEEQQVRAFFASPVAHLDTTITTRDCFFGPSAFAELFHRFQFETAPEADLSLFAPPVMDAALTAGEVRLGDILRWFRYDNRLVTVRISGEQLHQFLEKLFGMRYFRINGTESDLVRLKVPYYLHDDVAGIRFRVDLMARYGHRVTLYEDEQGNTFRPDGEYTVVLNSFRARDLEQMGLTVQTAAEDYRLALAAWLMQQKWLRPRARDNWSAGPERWVRAIAERERRTIFQP